MSPEARDPFDGELMEEFFYYIFMVYREKHGPCSIHGLAGIKETILSGIRAGEL